MLVDVMKAGRQVGRYNKAHSAIVLCQIAENATDSVPLNKLNYSSDEL